MSFTNYDKGRPGVFFMFSEAAQERLSPLDGSVVLLSTQHAAPAAAGETLTFTSRSAAKAGLGAESKAAEAAVLAFNGGASRVIVRTLPSTATTADYTAAFEDLAVELFEVLTFDHVPAAEALTATVAWVEAERDENDRYLFIATGGDAARDADPDASIAAALAHQDDFLVNLVNAPKFADKTYASGEYAPFVAGQLATLSLAGSLTYETVDGAIDVNKRLKPADVKAILVAGGYAYEFNGDIVRSVRGITTGGAKIRKSLLKQAMTTDVKALVERDWIGKRANGPNERTALQGVIGAYLDTLVGVGVLAAEYTVDVTKPEGTADDQIAVAISVKFQDAIEEVYISVGFQA